MGELHELGMPRLGVAMQEGTVLRWLKAVGEEVAQDELLLVIENDKVEIDVPSPWAGTLEERLAAEGDVVPVLQTIARIREAECDSTIKRLGGQMTRRRIPLLVAILGASIVAVSLSVAAASARSQATIKISIPGSTTATPATVVVVAVPPAGTTLGIVTPYHPDPGQAAMDTANQNIAKLVGAKSVMEDSLLDASKQLQIADSMLNRGFKPITTDIIFPHSMDAFLKRAAAKKVPACVEFSTTPGGAQEDDTQAGREMADYLHELFPNGATGAILANTPAAVILNREAGFAKGLKKYPNLKIIAKQRNLKEVVAEARTLAEGMLQANSGIQFFWTTNDNEALGAGLAAASLGKKIVILGMNGTPEAVDAVKKGIITATWDSNQNLMGSLVAVNCFNWLASGKAPKASLVPFTRITKANAAQWIPWPKRPGLTVVVK